MRLIGLAGSPRRNGNTDLLLEEMVRGASESGASTAVIILSRLDIKPCQHCDYCVQHGSCTIQDDMQMVYREMEAADCIVLASPVQFMGLTADIKAAIDRCQVFWARKYVLKKSPLIPEKVRKGFFISVGGRKVEGLFDPSLATVKTFFRIINVSYEGELLFKGVDEKGAIKSNRDALQQAYLAGKKLVE